MRQASQSETVEPDRDGLRVAPLGAIPVLSPEALLIAQQHPDLNLAYISADELQQTISAAHGCGLTVVEVWATVLGTLRERGLAGVLEMLGLRVQ